MVSSGSGVAGSWQEHKQPRRVWQRQNRGRVDPPTRRPDGRLLPDQESIHATRVGYVGSYGERIAVHRPASLALSYPTQVIILPMIKRIMRVRGAGLGAASDA